MFNLHADTAVIALCHCNSDSYYVAVLLSGYNCMYFETIETSLSSAI